MSIASLPPRISTKRTPDYRAALERLFSTAVAAVDPEALVAGALHVTAGRLAVAGEQVGLWPLPSAVLGAGKAAARMARGAELVLGGRARGIVVTSDGNDVPLERISCDTAAHPIPDRRGLRATAAIIAHAEEIGSSETCLFLLSGGASSLLVEPAAPLRLEEKMATNELLLLSGASIAEINAVRKHLSGVKGGGLLRRCRGRMISLILSDVIGDDPSIIGSGPTTADPSTFAEALEVLRRYDLLDRVPETVRARLEAGGRGELPETVKPGDLEARRAVNVILGSNRIALEAAARQAAAWGWEVQREESMLAGDTGSAAAAFGSRLCQEWERSRRDGRTRCLLTGGETTVQVSGSGSGGRNQEFALVVAHTIAGLPVTLLSAGSDGIDGPTDVAGAFADGSTLERARDLGLDLRQSLADNDSYPVLQRLGDHFRPGSTGTNVMDLKLAVIPPR